MEEANPLWPRPRPRLVLCGCGKERLLPVAVLVDKRRAQGTSFKDLNLKIIQTKHRKIIDKYFPSGKIEESKLKAVHTPFCTGDSD
eukprot:scaffold118670_cov37-Cyclotella_meneghiniana.AAC.1